MVVQGAARTMAKYPTGPEGAAVYLEGSLCALYFRACFLSCPAAAAALFLEQP